MGFEIRKTGKWNLIYGFILIAMAVLYSCLTYVTPLYIDDWMFLSNWKEHAGSSDFTFKGWWNYYEFTRGYDNGRIANALAVFTSMFSPFKEIFPILNGIMMTLLVVLCKRIACFNRTANKTVWICLTWFCCMVFLPWAPLFVADYSLNYIWGAVLNLGFLYCLLIYEKRGWTSTSLLLCILLSVIAGGWHESMAIESICGLGLVILVKNKSLSPYFYLVSLIFLIFTFIFGFSQGMRDRFEWEWLSSFKLPPKRVLAVWVVFLVYLVVVNINKDNRKQLRTNLKSPISLCCIGIIISGYGIALITRNEPRVFFWANIGVVILLLYNIRHSSFARILRTYKSLVFFLISLLPLFCIFQLIRTITLQERAKNFWNEIYAQLKQSNSGIVYYDPDLDYEKGSSRFLMIPPVGTEIDNTWQNQTLWMYFRTPFLSLIPRQLKEIETSDMKPIDGNLEGKLIDGFIISDYSPGTIQGNERLPYGLDLKIRMKNGKTIKDTFIASPYIPLNQTDNPDTLMYISLPKIDPLQIISIDFQ